jgi:uncharacterized protein (DUF488 family)
MLLPSWSNLEQSTSGRHNRTLMKKVTCRRTATSDGFYGVHAGNRIATRPLCSTSQNTLASRETILCVSTYLNLLHPTEASTIPQSEICLQTHLLHNASSNGIAIVLYPFDASFVVCNAGCNTRNIILTGNSTSNKVHNVG